MAILLGRRERFYGLAGAVGLLAALGCSGGGGGGGKSSSGSTAAPTTSRTTPTTTTPAGLSLGAGRALHTATILKSGAIFVAGGVDSAGNSMGETSIVTLNAVVSGPRLLQGRVGHSATLLENGQVLISGGLASVNTPTALDSTELFDPLAGAVTAGPKLTSARSEATAVTFGPAGSQMVLMAGGSDGAKKLDSAEVLDVKGNKFSALPVKLAEAVAGAEGARLDDGSIVLVGGDTTSGSAGAQIFNPQTLTFAATNITVRRSGGAFAANGRQALIAGGASSVGVEKSTETYDIASKLFSQSALLLNQRRDATANIVSQGVVIVGGRDSSKPRNDVELLSGPTLAQSQVAGVASLSTGRFGHTSTVLSGKVLVIGGFDAAGTALASIETIDPATIKMPAGVVGTPTTGTGTGTGTGTTLPPAPGGTGSGGLGGILGGLLGGLTGGGTGSTGGSLLSKVATAAIQTVTTQGFSGGIGGFLKGFAGNLAAQFFPPTSTIGGIIGAILPPTTSSTTGSTGGGIGGVIGSLLGGLTGGSSGSGGGIGGTIGSLLGGLFGGGSSSSTPPATGAAAATVTLMTPNSGPVGTIVSITGNNLGTANVTVSFKKKQGIFGKIIGFITGGSTTNAVVSSITGTAATSTIKLNVPSDADTGTVNVTAQSGAKVAAGTFTVK